MTQRNPLNERYTDDNRTGKTRKSAASAKVATKAASSVHEPAAKSKKQKKAEQQERDRKIRERRGVTGANVTEAELRQLPEYKRLRRAWWVCLGIAITMTALAWGISAYTGEEISYIPLIIAWACIIVAFYIDLWKIRKLRNQYRYSVNDKSKATRAAQKQHAAELREKRKQEELNPTPEKPTVLDRIKSFFGISKKAEDAAEDAAEAVEVKTK